MKRLIWIVWGWMIAFHGAWAQNNSMNFDGVNDFIQVGDHPDFNALGQITISAWVYPTNILPTGEHILINKEDEWELAIKNGQLAFAGRNIAPGWAWVFSGASIPEEVWTHVAFTYDGANYRFYVNGVLVSTVAATGAFDASNTYNNDVLIGRRLLFGGSYYKGNIDELAIWNVARTTAEIQSDMLGNIDCASPGLLAYYTFDQGMYYEDNTAISAITDCTTNHNGIPVNFSLFGCVSNFHPGFVPGASGIRVLDANTYSVCPDSTVTYVVAGFENGVSWNATGGTIIFASLCKATVQWDPTGPYSLTISEVGVDTLTLHFIGEEDINMVCNDLVNISVDSVCEALVTPAMVLEGELYPDASYELIIYDSLGNVIPNNTVNGSHVGQILIYKVKHKCSGNQCWGRIRIEDKWIPPLLCSDTAYIVSCDSSVLPEDVGLPIPDTAMYTRTGENNFEVTGFDPCGPVTLSYRDVKTVYGCAGSYYAVIVREWKATDASGNMTRCIDSIKLTRSDIANVVFPKNWDGQPGNNPVLECDAKGNTSHPMGWNPLPNGNPSPYPKVNTSGDTILIGTGYPTGVGCDHIAVTFRDTKIPICGGAYKLLRRWKVIDWCTGQIRDTIQLIKVMDLAPPVIACPGTNGLPADTVPTDFYSCTATYIAPIPIENPNPPPFDNKNVYVLYECSDWTYEVHHKPAVDPNDCTPDNSPGTPAEQIGVDPSTGLPVYRISNMPLGCNWLYYIFTDACGNKDTCQFDIYVKDTRPPVAICDQHTTVTLDADGTAKIYASSFDDGSYDNCMIDTILVRRMNDYCGNPANLTFRPFVEFCCADIPHNRQMVIMRVWDKFGNYSDCMVEVTVQDKIPPSLVCPPDVAIECDQDYRDTSITGSARADDICAGVHIWYRDVSVDTTVCGLGEIVRRWYAEDAAGLRDSCDQHITIQNSDPFDETDILWPPSFVTVNGCTEADAHPDLIPSNPKRPRALRNDACANIIVGYEDQIFHDVPGACLKILRTWTVIDWCQYDRNNPGSGRGEWSFVQTILVVNTQAPIIDPASCRDTTISSDVDCSAPIRLTASATDDCTPSDDLIWNFSVDFDDDGTIDTTGEGPSAEVTLPSGQHRFTWIVTDQCGNSSSCDFVITVRDMKKPSPLCKSGIVTSLMNDSTNITIWASDFNAKSFDNCTPASELRYSFSPDVNDNYRHYNCDSLKNGISDTFELDMWVTDKAGNQSYCTVKLVVQDNMDVCPDMSTAQGIISGYIRDPQDQGITNVRVELLRHNDFFSETITSSDGAYRFEDLPLGDDYIVKPRRNDRHLNGVTTLDIIRINKHILGIQIFDNPYTRIAADVNMSKSITGADIVVLRNLILGRIRKLPVQRSWIFFPANTQFSNPFKPWYDVRETYEVRQLYDAVDDVHFIGVKLGDVTGDARPNRIDGANTTREEASLSLRIDNMHLQKGKVYRIPVYASEPVQLKALQGTWLLNGESLHIEAVESGSLQIASDNVNYAYADQGLIPFLWYDDQARELDPSQPLFYLIVKAFQNTELFEQLDIGPAITAALAYDSDERAMNVALRWGNTDRADSKVVLYQNVPNPFTHTTLIHFRLPVEDWATLRIYDDKGRQVWHQRFYAQKGLNSVQIDNADLPYGVLIYELRSCGTSLKRKMIRLR